MLNNEPRKASIVAVTQATLMYLTRDMLFRVIDKDKLENGSVNKYARMKTITRNKRR